MSVGLDHPAVAAYLARLDAAAAVLPPGRREELITEIRGHLLDSLAAADRPDDAAVLDVLDRLGDPESIVAAEASETLQSSVSPAVPAGMPGVLRGPPPGYGLPVRQEGRWGPLEIIAVGALTVGTFLLPIIGPVIGIVCAWFSTRWTRREKAIATVLASVGVALVTIGALALVTAGLPSGNVTTRVTVVTATPSPVPTVVVPPPAPSVTTPPGGAP